jgi:hypothetical protein
MINNGTNHGVAQLLQPCLSGPACHYTCCANERSAPAVTDLLRLTRSTVTPLTYLLLLMYCCCCWLHPGLQRYLQLQGRALHHPQHQSIPWIAAALRNCHRLPSLLPAARQAAQDCCCWTCSVQKRRPDRTYSQQLRHAQRPISRSTCCWDQVLMPHASCAHWHDSAD